MPQIDTNTLLTVGLVCGGLCVVGLVLSFGLQLVGVTLNTVMSFVGLFGTILNGGPGLWCGCLVLILICGGVVGAAMVVATCNGNPTAMNFCSLLPR